MATTYLTLTNSVLRELNETELTSSTFSSSRGIQTAIKDFINKGIHDVYNETGEIPVHVGGWGEKKMLGTKNRQKKVQRNRRQEGSNLRRDSASSNDHENIEKSAEFQQVRARR